MSKSQKNKHLEAILKKFNLDQNYLEKILYNIFLSREVDNAEIRMKKQNNAYFQISGAGHEGIMTCAGFILRPAYDYFIPYYRDRALCLALGVTPYEMLCQANGNLGDISSGGRQMPSHWGKASLNIISKSSCTGTQFNQAVGIAHGLCYLKDHQLKQKNSQWGEKSVHGDEIVYTSCGDGTVAQGEFWEGLTSAIVGKLPVLFMVEDNGYAISVPNFYQMPQGSISKTLHCMPGLKVIEVDGNCPILSYAAIMEAQDLLRDKNLRQPVLLHAHVTRPYSHSLSDDHSFYRTNQELAKEKEMDVFYSFPNTLKSLGIFNQEKIDSIWEKVVSFVRLEQQRTLETTCPAPCTHSDHLFSQDGLISKNVKGEFSGKDDIPMAMTINQVLKSQVKSNPYIRMFGEDVADFCEEEKLSNPNLKGKGGVFKVTSGVQRIGLKNQVYSSPLAEANIIGNAIGMSLIGIKPVVEIQFFDYIWPAFMQLKNEMATMRYRSNGQFSCPMVVRVAIGGYLKGGAIYHSQCGESIFTHIPGIYVVFPSCAKDAAGLLRTAINCNDPVLFLEHKHLYYQGHNRCADPGENFCLPFGEGNLCMEGSDYTVVTWGACVNRCLSAMKLIQENNNWTGDLIDLRTLAPLDWNIIEKSLKKTNRILIVHEETLTSGFAGELMALINERAFTYLDAPPMRLAAIDTHVAYCPQVEDVILPQTSHIVTKIEQLCSY